ncbi:MAG: hypothetical protein HYV97_02620 [Bdellovibrio sp.]|nr:hypothetical protein [Bdellovibrio sp.]
MDSRYTHHPMRQKIFPQRPHHLNPNGATRHLVISPLKKGSNIKMVASMTIACMDVARALGGIYLYALYRQTVGRIINRRD